MTEYEQGSSPVFYVTFADANGEPASVVSGTITVRHRWGSSTTTDVDDANLTQLNGSTYYYSNWSIPSAADRTVYDVRYIGTYSDGTIAIGDETFYVIGRAFFDKSTGGGMVRNVTKRDTWTKEEKDKLLETISELAEKHNVETSLSQSALTEIKSNFSGLSKNLVSFSDDFINLSDKISKNANKSDMELSLREIDEVKLASKRAIELVESQKRAIDETLRVISELTAKDQEKDSVITKKISILSEAISGLNTEIRNERIGYIISELDELRSDSNELKKLVVMSAPREVLESLKNGITEANTQ
jgi:hypothetical protein